MSDLGPSRQAPHSWQFRRTPASRRAYHCRCARPIFFNNSLCLGCEAALGYEPAQALLCALEPGPVPDTWQLVGQTGPDATVYQRCANFHLAAGCNWLLPQAQAAAHEGLCIACRLNRTIPDLGVERHGVLWQRVEVAKRRLVSSLLALGLPVRSRVTEDPQHGLAFDILAPDDEGEPAMTGHGQGVVTINLEEADDAQRERIRTALREPYRTLLGHFRHEVGHYYWDRLVAGTDWLEPFRALFGDERREYAEALRLHYEQGPPEEWALRHVSAYASAHPWEDWAETWSHYLHMVDTLDTALSFGLDADAIEIEYEPFGLDALFQPRHPGAARFLSFVNAWIELTGVLNELSRSMGQADFYPFVLPHAAVRKLHFVHLVVEQAAGAAPAC